MSIPEKILMKLLRNTELGETIIGILHDSFMCARKLRVEYKLADHKINSIEPKMEYELHMRNIEKIEKILDGQKPE